MGSLAVVRAGVSLGIALAALLGLSACLPTFSSRASESDASSPVDAMGSMGVADGRAPDGSLGSLRDAGADGSEVADATAAPDASTARDATAAQDASTVCVYGASSFGNCTFGP